MDSGSGSGGIAKLRELIAEHPAELAYDLRERFGLSMFDVGGAVTYGEAVMLVAVLMRDPSSWTCAATSGWNFPVSREWIVAAHTYDLHALANSSKGKKPKPYPTPFPNRDVKKVGRTDRSPDEVRGLLARMNPKD